MTMPTPIGSQPIQFRTSLSSMRQAAREAQMEKDRMALGAGDGGALPFAFEATRRGTSGLRAATRALTTTRRTSAATGTSGLLFLGTDYRITPDLIVGGLVQWDRSKDEVGRA